SILVDGPTRRKEPTHDETETPPDIGPEDVFSRPLVDVPDAVRGDLREPSRGGGRGERAQRPHGHDLRPGCQGGSSARLVPPRRVGRSDARGMAGPGRADPRPLAREAETLALSRTASGFVPCVPAPGGTSDRPYQLRLRGRNDLQLRPQVRAHPLLL